MTRATPFTLFMVGDLVHASMKPLFHREMKRTEPLRGGDGGSGGPGGVEPQSNIVKRSGMGTSRRTHPRTCHPRREPSWPDGRTEGSSGE